MSTVAPSLAGWMARQRWYAAKGSSPEIRVIGRLSTRVDEGTVHTLFVIDEAPLNPVLYQVPVVARPVPLPGGENAFIGSDGECYLYDGPHDPAYARILLSTITDQAALAGAGVQAVGHRLTGAATMIRSQVLAGEQSNTSIVYDLEGGGQAIAKVFRILHHGDNPDVTSQAALTRGGSTRVAPAVGFVTATWPDPGRSDGVAHGQIAFAQEFLAGSEDAWRVALHAARSREDFSRQARELGAATAEVHIVLARELGTVTAGPAEVEAAVASMRRRLATAVREVPGVADFADRIRGLYDRVGALPWPELQRIHGDLHLGQALHSAERGWVLLDFEGEPLRPMPERSRADVALRDVAGMLRSFDYVGGSLAREASPVDAETWVAEARRCYVDGYVATTGVELSATEGLLDALELDKAIYEAIYEARNRPDWVGIPLNALARLTAAIDRG